MIENATLTQLTTAPASDGRGGTVAGSATALTIRCFIDQPSRAQRIALEGRISEATAVLCVEQAAGVPAFAAGQIVTVSQDEFGVHVLTIVHVRPMSHFGQSHYEIFGRAA